MRKLLAVVGILAGVWMVITPWALPNRATASSGGMMGMMHQQTSTIVINASSYYWHVVPGVLAILLSLTALLYASAGLQRLLAVALFVVGIWSAAGPWVLPHWGLGDMMMSGVTAGTFVRHILPGVVIIVCAVGLLLAAMTPVSGRAREPVPAR